MSQLFQAMNAHTTTTENGMKAYGSTLNKVLDFFYLAPATRNKSIVPQFMRALEENTDLTLRCLLWLRDARGGAGERQTFRNLVKELPTELAEKILVKIPELGRFDDLTTFWGTPLEATAANIWLNHMRSNNALAFKWAPRKDKKGAKPLRKLANMNEKTWRKFVVENSNTVEQSMCAKDWDSINFEHVPSVAMSRYMRAFDKNTAKFSQYKAKLEAGTAKINASVSFPHDIVKACRSGDSAAASAQWASLPDFMAESNYKHILPVVDTSGSMYTPVSGNSQAIDVAMALGIYCSERNEGHFKDKFITFSNRPQLQDLKGSLSSKLRQLEAADWGMTTNLESVFNLILISGIKHKVPASEMPEVIIIPSDMQFNSCVSGNHLIPSLKSKYAQAGYELPKVVFWQVNARAGCIPVSIADNGTALISGFSPTILKSVLSGELNPEAVMLRTLSSDRYSVG